jgi:hypothetical protein
MKKPKGKKKPLRSRKKTRWIRREAARVQARQVRDRRAKEAESDVRRGRRVGDVGAFEPIAKPSPEQRRAVEQEKHDAAERRKKERQERKAKAREDHKRLSARVYEWMASLTQRKKS